MINILILFIFGIAVGSFLNVVSLRYNPDGVLFAPRDIGGRSRCPNCRATLKWYDLVPLVSFIVLLGKCRYCRKPISWQYPTVELLAGLSFLFPIYFLKATGADLYFSESVPAWFYALSAVWVAALLSFILITVIDLRHFIIPDGLNIFLAALGLVKIFTLYGVGKFDLFYGTFLKNYALLFGFIKNIFVSHAVAAVFGLVFFGIIILATRGKGMGLGDLKLAAALGVLFGWPDIVLVLVLSFIVGSIVSVPLLIRGTKGLKDALPFGPYIVASAALVMLFGQDIIRGYLVIFGL